MNYTNTTYARAAQALKRRRAAAEAEAAKRCSVVFLRSPEARALDQKIRSAGPQFAAILAQRLQDPDEIRRRMDALRDESLKARADLELLLQSMGYPADYLEPPYTCKTCGDTGSRDGVVCGCFTQLLKTEAFAELCENSPLALCSFEDFDLSYYPDRDGSPSSREIMRSIYDYCVAYAEDFSAESPNLLLYGGTGLGKTHLSLSIAKVALENGFGVVYDSCPNLMAKLEDEKFGRAEAGAREAVMNCDLLILDDLGAEFSTQFTAAAVYDILNTRLLRRLPTIINTNLNMTGLQDKYTERVASRLIGDYVLLQVTGRDIRQLKNR